MSQPTDPRACARAYAALFPEVYLRFHRRDAKRSSISSASHAVLLHLAQSGPLSVGECAKHLDRAQSVVSEIVDQLEGHGLLARVRDGDDRRRTLVWLTDDGRQRLMDAQDVLGGRALELAVAAMKPRERAMLLAGTVALVRAADRTLAAEAASLSKSHSKGEQHESRKTRLRKLLDAHRDR